MKKERLEEETMELNANNINYLDYKTVRDILFKMQRFCDSGKPKKKEIILRQKEEIKKVLDDINIYCRSKNRTHVYDEEISKMMKGVVEKSIAFEYQGVASLYLQGIAKNQICDIDEKYTRAIVEELTHQYGQRGTTPKIKKVLTAYKNGDYGVEYSREQIKFLIDIYNTHCSEFRSNAETIGWGNGFYGPIEKDDQTELTK